MKHIGIKIKELRKKKDMTQEKLAEYLNVSFQAISKWETGVASPDVSMIVPLARLLGVSADELFGLKDNVADPRQAELENLWGETWPSGDTAKRYEIAKIAVAEYPENFNYLLWLADAEQWFATHNCDDNTPEQSSHYENSIRCYERIIEDCDDISIKNDALYGIVFVLNDLYRLDEAKKYAEQHPQRDELLLWCLKGEERDIHRQNLIIKTLGDLVLKLEFGKPDLSSAKAAEKIIKAIIDDENYLYMNSRLAFNSYYQAVCFTSDGLYDEAVEKMKECYSYAVEHEKMLEMAKEKPIYFTCDILSKLSFDANDYSKIGVESEIENFRELLRRDALAPLRERDDYKKLLEL